VFFVGSTSNYAIARSVRAAVSLFRQISSCVYVYSAFERTYAHTTRRAYTRITCVYYARRYVKPYAATGVRPTPLFTFQTYLYSRVHLEYCVASGVAKTKPKPAGRVGRRASLGSARGANGRGKTRAARAARVRA